MAQRDIIKGRFLSLSPLFLFLTLYLVTSLLAGDFYTMPISVAFIASSIYAITLMRGMRLNERLEHFSAGAADKNILLMIWIFILAGAFAQSAKAMGAVDATVDLALTVIPPRFLTVGIFLASCFISISIGTSVGTIVALMPIVSGLAAETGLDTAYLSAIVVGGSFFGDNLSFISDTTIAATRTQECAMVDKFRTNFRIVLPAALVTLMLYLVGSADMVAFQEPEHIEWLKVVPYLLVLIFAIIGMPVMIVLVVGIAATGIIGVASGTLGVFDWCGELGEGILSMGELIIITLLAGGMLETIRINGGIDYLISRLTRHITGPRGAQGAIAALVCMANLCTANNTIAILSVGSIAREIADRFGVDRRKSASLLDTFSCFVQGFLPYGPQLMMAASLASISPLAIISKLYYPLALGICAVIAILIGRNTATKRE